VALCYKHCLSGYPSNNFFGKLGCLQGIWDWVDRCFAEIKSPDINKNIRHWLESYPHHQKRMIRCVVTRGVDLESSKDYRLSDICFKVLRSTNLPVPVISFTEIFFFCSCSYFFFKNSIWIPIFRKSKNGLLFSHFHEFFY